MVSNSSNAVAAPNGLGDLTADAQRNTANGIIAKVPAGVPGFDYTPYQLGAVATGVLRTRLRTGVPITFADIYDVAPLGISPRACSCPEDATRTSSCLQGRCVLCGAAPYGGRVCVTGDADASAP